MCLYTLDWSTCCTQIQTLGGSRHWGKVSSPVTAGLLISNYATQGQIRWGLQIKWAGVTSVCMLFTDTTHVQFYLPVCQSLPCCRDVGGSVLGSVPAVGQSGHSQVWAVMHHSPTSSLCCYFSHDASWEGKKTKGLRLRFIKSTQLAMEKRYILHFELVAVAFRQHTCVGEREPATPKKSKHLVKLTLDVYCT